MIDILLQRYALIALAAAALFGASTPAAKLLLGDVPPLGLAGLLYLGSGCGLVALRLVRKLSRATRPHEASLTRDDLPWLAGAVVCGGAIAPVLLLAGLRGTGAATASLLLNLEGVLTTLLAAALFREAVAPRVWIATALIVVGGALLGWQPGSAGEWSWPALAIAGACLFWALDNNLTRKISAVDPVTIATIKGLCAGSINLGLAMLTGMHWPAAGVVLSSLALGFVSYGISLVLFILALRHLGSARASAHFGAAPFFGAAIAVAWLGDPLTGSLIVALLLMAAATWLLLGETHAHPHTHEPLVHSHRHVHDAHHRHSHEMLDADPGPEPHVHAHRHEPVTHAHPHLPDIHHRHRHVRRRA
jgi:drug/metabolite transporter (DMT)-like permease